MRLLKDSEMCGGEEDEEASGYVCICFNLGDKRGILDIVKL